LTCEKWEAKLTDTKDVFNNSKIGSKPSLRKLQQFINKGGYAILEKAGTGITAEERQSNAWKTHGIITELAKQTKITRKTLIGIKSWYPTLKSTGAPSTVWLKEEDFELLSNVDRELDNLEKHLKRAQDIVERSFLLDSAEIHAHQQIGGLSLEDAIKNEWKMREAGENVLGKILTETLDQVYHIGRSISQIRFNAKKV
jgi:hypothetical protein